MQAELYSQQGQAVTPQQPTMQSYQNNPLALSFQAQATAHQSMHSIPYTQFNARKVSQSADPAWRQPTTHLTQETSSSIPIPGHYISQSVTAEPAWQHSTQQQAPPMPHRNLQGPSQVAAAFLAQQSSAARLGHPAWMSGDQCSLTPGAAGTAAAAGQLAMGPGHVRTSIAADASAAILPSMPATAAAVLSELPLERYMDLHAALERGTGCVQSFSAVEAVMFRIADLKQVGFYWFIRCRLSVFAARSGRSVLPCNTQHTHTTPFLRGSPYCTGGVKVRARWCQRHSNTGNCNCSTALLSQVAALNGLAGAPKSKQVCSLDCLL